MVSLGVLSTKTGGGGDEVEEEEGVFEKGESKAQGEEAAGERITHYQDQTARYANCIRRPQRQYTGLCRQRRVETQP